MEIIFFIIVLLLFFFLAWVFNGFETGMISLDRFELEQEAKKNKTKKKILHFYENSDKVFGTTLIGNNIANVIIAAISTYLFTELFGMGNVLSTLLIAFLVLIFCEILSKNLFREFPNTFVVAFFPLVNSCYILMKPMIKIVTFINIQMKKLFKIEQNPFQAFTKDDLALIVEETFNQGNIQKPQKEMLEDALEFTELIAKNVMTPRTDIVAIPEDLTYDEIVKITREEGYTRYPVYHETLDEITGVLIVYDLLKPSYETLTAKDMKREMYFVPESMDVDVLLKEMQKNQKSIAIVVDAYGGTAGLVTMEDILEEIVGEIDDEYDVEEIKDVEKVDDNTWIVNAFVEVDTLNDNFDLELPDGDYETIAGLILSHLEQIPARGKKITIGKYKFEILEVTNKKIKKVRIVGSV